LYYRYWEVIESYRRIILTAGIEKSTPIN